jgi:hypothetical protein
MRIFSHKICCDLSEARLVASKFFKIVLGGTAALHAYRVWGAVIFWRGKRPTLNAERSILKRRMANLRSRRFTVSPRQRFILLLALVRAHLPHRG